MIKISPGGRDDGAGGGRDDSAARVYPGTGAAGVNPSVTAPGVALPPASRQLLLRCSIFRRAGMHKCRQRQVEKMLLHFRHFRHPWRSDAESGLPQ